MMRKTFLQVQAGKTAYLPLPEESRVINAYAVPDTAQTSQSSAQITVGNTSLSSTSHAVLQCSLASVSAGATVNGAYVTSATTAEKNQVWDTNNVLKITPAGLAASTVVGVWVVTDPFVIGPRTSL